MIIHPRRTRLLWLLAGHIIRRLYAPPREQKPTTSNTSTLRISTWSSSRTPFKTSGTTSSQCLWLELLSRRHGHHHPYSRLWSFRCSWEIRDLEVRLKLMTVIGILQGMRVDVVGDWIVWGIPSSNLIVWSETQAPKKHTKESLIHPLNSARSSILHSSPAIKEINTALLGRPSYWRYYHPPFYPYSIFLSTYDGALKRS